MIVNENLSKPTENSYNIIGHKVSISPIIIDYKNVKHEHVFVKKRKIIQCNSFLSNKKLLPKSVDFEINTKLVNKLFHYRKMNQVKKEIWMY